jgi:molybdate transport system ATP-binding protein
MQRNSDKNPGSQEQGMNLNLALQKKFCGFDFDVAFRTDSKRLGIFGRSGSGKSTLVNLLAGLLPADAGRLRFGDRLLYDSAQGICVSPQKRRIAVVFQHSHLFPHLTVERNLLYGYRRIPASERTIDPGELCRVLDISHLLQRSVIALSGGERQRVALGRGVLANPHLLLMDEPLSGLDEKLKYQIIPYLKDVLDRYDIPLVYVSHSMNEMRMLVDEVLVLENGNLASQTSPETLARLRMKECPLGYLNFFSLQNPVPDEHLWAYEWGKNRLTLTHSTCDHEGLFTLASKDIVLFRRHPESVSARNLLRGTVGNIFELDQRIGVELDCNGKPLVATIVKKAAEELGVNPGKEIYAAIKADAFRRVY